MDIDISVGDEEPESSGGLADALLQPGATVGGRFHIKALIGRGMLGEVYRAIDAKVERTAAVRIIPRDALPPPALERLRQGMQHAARFKHKNVAALLGMGETDDLTFITTEYVEGQSLRDLMASKGKVGKAFSLKGAYNVAAHCCNALSKAHDSMIHGLLSPKTILVNSAGRVKLIDFGFAGVLHDIKDFRERHAAGALYYVAPELAATPQAVDLRADFYSLGVVVYELLTGRPPATGAEPPSRLRADVHPKVDEVLARCLSPKPGDRFASASELKAALLAAVETKPSRPTAPKAKGRVPFGGAAGAQAVPVGTQPGVGPPKSAAQSQPPFTTQQGVGPHVPAAVARPPQPPAPPPTAPSAPGLDLGEQAPGGAGNGAVADAIDEEQERWLVQKDRLDFGPYSLREVRRQIESAEILGEHFIVDQETGQRRRIRDLPALREFVREGEVRREQLRREAADKQHKKQELRRFGLVAILAAVVLLGGGGTVAYVLLYRTKPVTTTKIVIQKDKSLDRDLQQLIAGLEIQSTVEARRRRRRGGSKRTRTASESGPDVINLGDVSQAGHDEQISADQINAVMRSRFRGLAKCVLNARRRNPGLRMVVIAFDVHGSGQAKNVKVNGSSGGPLTTCIAGRMSSFRFPKYDGPKTRARWDMRIQ